MQFKSGSCPSLSTAFPKFEQGFLTVVLDVSSLCSVSLFSHLSFDFTVATAPLMESLWFLSLATKDAGLVQNVQISFWLFNSGLPEGQRELPGGVQRHWGDPHCSGSAQSIFSIWENKFQVCQLRTEQAKIFKAVTECTFYANFLSEQTPHWVHLNIQLGPSSLSTWIIAETRWVLGKLPQLVLFFHIEAEECESCSKAQVNPCSGGSGKDGSWGCCSAACSSMEVCCCLCAVAAVGVIDEVRLKAARGLIHFQSDLS